MDDNAQVNPTAKMNSPSVVMDTSFWATWRDDITPSDFQTLGVKEATLITLLAVLLPLAISLWTLKTYKTIQDRKNKPFPFLQLPQELRDMIYKELSQDPSYPPPPCPAPMPQPKRSLFPLHWPSPSPPPTKKPSTWILLANKQIHKEYMLHLYKHSTFHLTLCPQNYPLPSLTSTSNLANPLWPMPTPILQNLRSCSLHLVTSSAMLAAPDPRTMLSTDWPLASLIREHLLPLLSSVRHLELDAKAIGDPLWNPLWIWFHAAQCFKGLGEGDESEKKEEKKQGPRFNRITFSLDTWSPGENYLARETGSAWKWYCVKGHCVCADGGVDMTVREFCAKLYQDCGVCCSG